jgi:hypothetical protein
MFNSKPQVNLTQYLPQDDRRAYVMSKYGRQTAYPTNITAEDIRNARAAALRTMEAMHKFTVYPEATWAYLAHRITMTELLAIVNQ